MSEPSESEFRPIPPEDARLLVMRPFSVEEICRTFSIPAHLLSGENPKGNDDANPR